MDDEVVVFFSPAKMWDPFSKPLYQQESTASLGSILSFSVSKLIHV